MSNEIVSVDSFTIPAYLQGAAPTKSDFGQAGGLPKIGVMKDGFKIVMDGQEKKIPAPLPVVILAVSPAGKDFSRAYYADPYQPGVIESPDCASSDGVTPDSGDIRQATQCGQCQWSQWGSSKTGSGKGQACTQGKTLYVVPANDPAGAVFQLRVSPTSLKPVAAYGAKLAAAGIPPAAVVTNLGIVLEGDTQFQMLTLDLAGFLQEEAGKTAITRSESLEIKSLVTVVEAAPQLEQPDPQPAPKTVAPEPEPQPESWGGSPQQSAEDNIAQPAPEDTQRTAGPEENAAPSVELDAAGISWSAEYHSSGKTKTKDGLWKKRRGAQTEGPAVQEQKATSGVAPLEDILNQWG